MKKEHMKKQYPHWCGVLLLYLMACITSCQDDKISSNGYDPSKPVVKEASVLNSISMVRISETTLQKFKLL